jgi:hypothetical protein
MSKVAIKGATTGTGTFTIESPATNTDRTLVLPDVSATLITNSAGILNIGSGQFYKDASGNVGVGTTTPTERLTVVGNILLPNGANRRIDIGSASSYIYSLRTVSDDFEIREDLNDNKIRLRIKYSGTPSAAGQLQLPIEGSATLYNAYTCRAWVNFDGRGTGSGTATVRANGNVSSVTRLSTGEFQINFATAMPDVNYGVFGFQDNGASSIMGRAFNTHLTTSVQVRVQDLAGTRREAEMVSVSIFR